MELNLKLSPLYPISAYNFFLLAESSVAQR